ncbi:MAG: extracellular solute-binding protein [Candidatus Spyradocola sp.]|nr:extracellular solute-binding protein [Candidatus Spyradocola sp.]
MKTWKQLVALILALLCCLSMVACAKTDAPAADTGSDKPTAEQPAESAETGKVKLSVVMLGYNDTQIEAAQSKDGGPVNSDNYYMTNREKAEAAYPDVTFEWNDWGWAETLDQKQRAAIAAGNPPSCIAGESFIPTYANSGILQEIPADVLEGVDPSFVAYGADGKPYALAYKTSIFMLFYNKDLLAKAGLDPEVAPKTWSEWQQMSEQITAAGAGEYWGGGVPSFPHNGGALRATPFFRQLGTDFGGNDVINLSDPKVQQVLAFIRTMDANFPTGLGNNSDEGPMWNAFEKKGEQNLAFAVNGTWQEASALRNGVNLGVAPLPLPDEGGQLGNCLVGTVYIGVPVGVSEEETRAFWDFYKDICLSEAQLQYWVDEGCVVPLTSMIQNDALYEGEGKAGLRVAVEALRNGTYTGQAAFAKNDSQIWEIINQQVLARVTMTQDPIDQICAQAQAQIEALLK